MMYKSSTAFSAVRTQEFPWTLPWKSKVFWKTGRFTAPMYLLIFQNLLYFLALRVGRWRAGDRDGARSFLLYVPLLVVFLLAFGLLLRCAGL